MRDILQDFKFMPDGATNLVDALCRFIKEEITFGRITGGEKLPTIGEICKATGLTFAQARRVTECLSREGYVSSRPHIGTVVLSRKGNVLRGRVLFILPDIDMGRYHPSQVIDMLSRRLTASGYAFSVATFSLDAADSLAVLKSELLRATDLVIAARATPQVQKVLAESGVNHFFVYGDKPESDDRPWIRFSPEEALSQFADHCLRAGVKHVAQVRYEGSETLDAQPALAVLAKTHSPFAASQAAIRYRGNLPILNGLFVVLLFFVVSESCLRESILIYYHLARHGRFCRSEVNGRS